MPRIYEIEGAELYFRNFSGKEGDYNPAGARNFGVFIPTNDDARMLEEDGWLIKWTKPRDPDEAPRPYLKVHVAFDHVPPTVKQITSRNQVDLDAETIGIVDGSRIVNLDLVLSAYRWEMKDKKTGRVSKSGVKAMLKEMYVTIQESRFAEKYRQTPNPIEPDEY